METSTSVTKGSNSLYEEKDNTLRYLPSRYRVIFALSAVNTLNILVSNSSPEDLSEMLAAGTKEVHEKAENTQFVKDFLRGRIKRELFKVSVQREKREIFSILIYRLLNKYNFLSFFFTSLDLWHFTILTQQWKKKLRGTKAIPILPLSISLQSFTATRPWPVTLSTFTALTGRAR